MNLKATLLILFASFLNFTSLYSQCECGTYYGSFPATIDGVDVTTIESGSISVYNAPSNSSCGFTVNLGDPSLLLGANGSYDLTFEFDPPVSSASIITSFLDDGTGLDLFNVSVDGGGSMSLSQVCGCLSISGTTVTCSTCVNDGGIVAVTSTSPFTQLTLSGGAGAIGFVVGLCGVADPLLCEIKASISDTNCDNNGTLSDPSDDFYFVDILVEQLEGESISGWIADDLNNTTGAYDDVVSFGPFLISDGPFPIVFSDVDIPDCNFELIITPPPPCSDLCMIDVELESITCFDNGTPSDPSDDTFFASIIVTGFNTATNWNLNDPNSSSGMYDVSTIIGPYNIDDGDQTFTISDLIDSNCTIDINLEAPPTCSPVCSIEYEISNIICEDNGTPLNPNDDVFFFDIFVSSSNASASWNANDINNSSGLYNEISTLGPYSISEIIVFFEIFDSVNNNCESTIIAEAPPTCSNECILNFEVENIFCEDNGTPQDTLDDVFFFELTVLTINGSDFWFANDPNNTAGTYNQTTLMGPYSIIDGSLIFEVNDAVNTDCVVEIEVEPPGNCSSSCEITFEIIDVLCYGNGTSIIEDDFYTLDILVSGNSNSTNWNSDDTLNSSGLINETTTIGPYAFADGTLQFTISDGECNIPFIYEPSSCSDSCVINYSILEFICDDNGTPLDTSDNNFSVEILIEGENESSSWIASDIFNTIGVYNESTIFGPFPVTSDDIVFLITDSLNPSCFVEIIIPPTENNDISEFFYSGCVSDSFSIVINNTMYDLNNPSGIELFTRENSCDSIVMVNLVFEEELTSEENYEGCFGDGFSIEVNGVIYNENNPSGTETLISANGCDSIVTIDLIFNDALTGEVTYEGCQGDGFSTEVNGTIYDEDNPFGSESLVSTFGCDSTVTIDLVFNENSEFLLDDEICESDEIIVNNTVYDINNPSGTEILPNESINGCDSIINIDLSFILQINVSISSSGNICSGESTEIIINHNAGTDISVLIFDGTDFIELSNVQDGFSFEVSPESSTTYSIESLDIENFNCEIIIEINEVAVTVNDLVIESTFTTDYNGFEVSCHDSENGSIRVVPSGGVEPYGYEWNTGDQTNEITDIDSGDYSITVTDSEGCQDEDMFQITAPFPITLDVISKSTDCDTVDEGEIIIDNIQGGVSPYDIFLDGTLEETTSTFPFMISSLIPAEYELFIVDANGCLIDSIFIIDEAELPTVDLGEDKIIKEGESVEIFANITGEIVNILWEPSELVSCDTCLIIEVSPTETTEFSIQIIDTNGCIATDTILVRVEMDENIYVPNIFSPNDDGINDILFIFTSSNVLEIETFSIYDRWGNLVFKEDNFEPNNEEVGWDGRYKGLNVKPGVFAYYVEFELSDGTLNRTSGTITVIR